MKQKYVYKVAIISFLCLGVFILMSCEKHDFNSTKKLHKSHSHTGHSKSDKNNH